MVTILYSVDGLNKIMNNFATGFLPIMKMKSKFFYFLNKYDMGGGISACNCFFTVICHFLVKWEGTVLRPWAKDLSLIGKCSWKEWDRRWNNKDLTICSEPPMPLKGILRCSGGWPTFQNKAVRSMPGLSLSYSHQSSAWLYLPILLLF